MNNNKSKNTVKLLEVGDSIGSTDFKVCDIVICRVKKYKAGIKRMFRCRFYLIKNSKGHERVLSVRKSKVTDSEMYFPTFGGGQKYKKWSMMEILESLS